MSDVSPLVIEDLGHHFDADAPVLSGVSLRVAPGELVSVLGASGSGKTTLLRAVAGFVTPTEGRVIIGGDQVVVDGRERVPAERRGVGLIFQDFALFPHLTVRENVVFGLHGHVDVAERVDELLKLVNLEAFASRRPETLSGGQQQRVAVARALAPSPRVLLMDEPFANLDASLRQDLGDELREILREAGVAALLVTHDRAEALGLSDRVAVLGSSLAGASGHLLQCDSPEVVYGQPVSLEVAALTGDVIVIPGEARGNEVETELGFLPLAVPSQGPVQVALRPSQLAMDGDGDVTGQIVGRRFTGDGYVLRVRVGGLYLSFSSSLEDAPASGASVRLRVQADVRGF